MGEKRERRKKFRKDLRYGTRVITITNYYVLFRKEKKRRVRIGSKLYIELAGSYYR